MQLIEQVGMITAFTAADGFSYCLSAHLKHLKISTIYMTSNFCYSVLSSLKFQFLNSVKYIPCTVLTTMVDTSTNETLYKD
jgi:hypothetical protein